jgi:hypothetical protein
MNFVLEQVLFMEHPEQYYNRDMWPPENDRPLMFRLAADVPVLQNTLIRIFVIGLSKVVMKDVPHYKPIMLSTVVIINAFKHIGKRIRFPVDTEVFPFTIPCRLALASTFHPREPRALYLY